eukprot:43251-Chlamydomonas_euryale.AAC.12
MASLAVPCCPCDPPAPAIHTSSFWYSRLDSAAAASCRLGSSVSGTTAVAPAFSRLSPCAKSCARTNVLTPGKCLVMAYTAR